MSSGMPRNFDRYYDPPEPPSQRCPICEKDSENCELTDDTPESTAAADGYIKKELDTTYESDGVVFIKGHLSRWEDYGPDTDPPDEE